MVISEVKIEEGVSSERAIIREIKKKHGCELKVDSVLDRVQYEHLFIIKLTNQYL